MQAPLCAARLAVCDVTIAPPEWATGLIRRQIDPHPYVLVTPKKIKSPAQAPHAQMGQKEDKHPGAGPACADGAKRR